MKKYPDANPRITKWMSDEIDRCVLEKLIETDRMKSLKKVIYGKPHQKNFRNLKKVKSGFWLGK